MVGAYERICCSIHHCQGRLSSAEKKQKQHLRYPPPSAGGETKHWRNVNMWRHDVREWARVFLCNAFLERAMLSSCIAFSFRHGLGGRFGEASQGRGQVGREGGEKILQFQPQRQSAGAGWAHMRTADALGKQVIAHGERLDAFLAAAQPFAAEENISFFFINKWKK